MLKHYLCARRICFASWVCNFSWVMTLLRWQTRSTPQRMRFVMVTISAFPWQILRPQWSGLFAEWKHNLWGHKNCTQQDKLLNFPTTCCLGNSKVLALWINDISHTRIVGVWRFKSQKGSKRCYEQRLFEVSSPILATIELSETRLRLEVPLRPSERPRFIWQNSVENSIPLTWWANWQQGPVALVSASHFLSIFAGQVWFDNPKGWRLFWGAAFWTSVARCCRKKGRLWNWNCWCQMA